MVTDDIPFTDMPEHETIDFSELANQYNRLLTERNRYRNALESIAEYQAPSVGAVGIARQALRDPRA